MSMVLREAERLYTVEAFSEIAALPENDERRLEWKDGVIVDTGSSSRLNTVTAIRIATFVNLFVMTHDLGVVTGADGGFRLPTMRRVRRPDVAFLSKSHGIDLVGVEFDIAPDLAVEVVSPDEDIFKKANEYLHAGTQIVWAVYTEERIVYAMTLSEDGAILSRPFGIGDMLEGGDVLPGFRLPVRDIFPQ